MKQYERKQPGFSKHGVPVIIVGGPDIIDLTERFPEPAKRVFTMIALGSVQDVLKLLDVLPELIKRVVCVVPDCVNWTVRSNGSVTQQADKPLA